VTGTARQLSESCDEFMAKEKTKSTSSEYGAMIPDVSRSLVALSHQIIFKVHQLFEAMIGMRPAVLLR
jgi:hypothetical protein